MTRPTRPAHMGAFDFSTLLQGVGQGLVPVLSQAMVNNYSTIEIRTTLSPPLLLNVADLAEAVNSKAPPSAISKFLKPTVILTDRAGAQNVIAPYGVASGGSALPGVMLIVGILGAAFLAGRWSTKVI